MAEKENTKPEKSPPIFGYGLCFAITLIPAIAYLTSRGPYYQWRGGLFYSIYDIVGDLFFCLLAMILGAFVLQLFLRKPKVWRGCVVMVVLAALCVFFNLRSGRPVSYLEEMLEEMPRAVEYFQSHRAELERKAEDTDGIWFLYEPPEESPASGYGHYMAFYYVDDLEDYPKQEGQQGISAYIQFLDEHWYLYMASHLGS